mgnify:CR=1 FL=1
MGESPVFWSPVAANLYKITGAKFRASVKRNLLLLVVLLLEKKNEICYVVYIYYSTGIILSAAVDFRIQHLIVHII